MFLCPSSNPLDLGDACVRTTWSALVPLALVAFYVLRLLSIGVFSRVAPSSSPLKEFLTFEEAESLEYDVRNSKDADSDESVENQPSPWFTTILAVPGLIETGSWLAIGAYAFATGDKGIRGGILALLFASTWLYACLSPALKPSIEPPFDLFALYLLHLVGACLMLGGAVFDHYVSGGPMPSRLALAGLIANLVVILGLLSLILSRPLKDPIILKGTAMKNVSPEDFTTLWRWVTFSWVNPLIEKGVNQTLEEEDVWDLSVLMQARPVFRKFSTLDQKRSLLWKIWAANSRDIILDFVGRLASAFCVYLDPYFLKRIVDAIDDGSSSSIARAYVFAVLMFCFQMLRSQADLQHLWHGRRAATRIRSELMSAIYDKALKRKDLSGIVHRQEKEEKGDERKGKRKKKGRNGDELKAGADIGKIVNLMAGDASRIEMLFGSVYNVYGAPFEIMIAAIFLYRLLGVAAFAGFAALLLLWPFNNFIARRAVHIQKGVMVARDRRMGVVNELLGALKFIKFFAWEEKWIARTEDSRAEELRWLVKIRLNSVISTAAWLTSPILVSVVSLYTYVSHENELTVGTAFTAITLFFMIRGPLNSIPRWVVKILQGLVSIRRIEAFLNEDEVGPQVSTLKEDTREAFSEIMVLGLESASLKWNAVGENETSDDRKSIVKDNNTKAKDVPQRDIEAALTDTPDVSQTGTEPLEGDHVFELRDISVVFPDGALTIITGPTASGKTALLLALLGEMTLTSGQILMHKDPHHVYENGLTHSISYAAQTPWLQEDSIKENILFGAPFEPERYATVLDACSLRPDLAILEDGDETEIGPRGISLSGGQKARVALARAVYARTKFVLLDDPLSAVDSHTARHLFLKLLMGPLLNDRTVILVTHHIELVLPGAHYLVRMLNGRIDVQGTVNDLRKNGALDAITTESGIGQGREGGMLAGEKEEQEAAETIQGDTDGEGDADGTVPTKGRKQPRKFVQDEERETGSVKWRIYRTYLEASSYWTLSIIWLLILCVQTLGVTEKYWIKLWGEAYKKGESVLLLNHLFSSNLASERRDALPDAYSAFQSFGQVEIGDHFPRAQEDPMFYVAVYALIGLLTVITRAAWSAMQFTGAFYASRTLFSRLLRSVVRASMRWLDTVPTGRILNRFSKDIETIDYNLVFSLQDVNRSASYFLAHLIVIVAVLPPFVIPAIFIGYFHYKVGIGYLSTGRDLRRMESNTRSPIFSGFSELLEGLVTVRAFSAEPRFKNSLYRKIDLTLRMSYRFYMSNRWMLLRFDLLGSLVVFCTTMFTLSSSRPGRAGWAGLSITTAIQFMNTVYHTCRFWTTFELNLNSVERVVEYLDLPQEPPAVIENSRPPAHWPSSSGPNEEKLIEVKDLVIRYAPDLPAVLHQISFTLRARERVGLLGRTGSGKSTLAMSLLRFTDPTEGRIKIDGIDITTIGVNDLRSRMTFIPQDATLFSGTIRDNLDPFGDFSDLECMDALRRVQVISDDALASQCSSRAPSIRNVEREETAATAVKFPHIAGSFGTACPSTASSVSSTVVSENGNASEWTKISLNTEVSSGGLNFSAGQRQLIAMARALLRRSAVVVLDEATSSIDFATDAKIQQAIREEFSDSLLLTIAHRLHTVIDYDRLLVLDAGRVVEFDTPYNLIEKEGGIFHGMCMKSGNFAELRQAAKTKAESS